MAGELLRDRCKETTTTTGTGTIDLAGTSTGYRTLVAGVGNGNTCYYAIVHQTLDEWEVGKGTVTDASPDTLSRTTILASSNSGSAVNFSAGTKDVWVDFPAAIITPAGFTLTLSANATVGGTNTGDNGTVTSVATTAGITGGTITTTGTLSLDLTYAATWTGVMTVAPTLRTSGVAPYWRIVTPADTAQTASTESIGIALGGTSANPPATVTRQYATGALALHREYLFTAPTLAAVGASTITTAVTVEINAAPVQGTNATLTNKYALRVVSGVSQFNGGVTSPGVGSGALNEFFGVSAGHATNTGGNNTCIGYAAGNSMSGAGAQNVYIGSAAGQNAAANASFNVCIGNNAGYQLATNSQNNVFIGSYSGFRYTGSTNAGNTCVGANTYDLSGANGARNTIIGSAAGNTTLTTGSDNTLLGQSADTSTAGATFQTAIGANSVGSGNNTVTLGRLATDTVYAGATILTQPATGTVTLINKAIASRTAQLLQFQTSAAGSLGNVSGGCVGDVFADVSTTHTDGTFDTLRTDTLVANALIVNGDKIRFRYCLTVVSHVTNTADFKLAFAGVTLFDSGAITFATTGTVIIEGYVIRKSSTTCRAEGIMTQAGSTSAVSVPFYVADGTLTGLTLTGTNTLVLSAAAAGTGAASADVVLTMGTVHIDGFGS